MTTVGVLHPGEMGSAVGAAAVAGGARVLWASAGRSAATRARAQADMLEDVGTLARLAAESRIILSVCPPANALAVARDVVAVGFRGTYVDVNAVAPETARKLGDVMTAASATFVDGGIIGPPPRGPAVARLYLSGPAASDVAALFRNGSLEVVPVAGPIGAASAVKIAYAAWNKGSQALLMAVRALAMREGVDEVLLGEWTRSQPELTKRSESAVAATARKAWRFVGEMEEIAATFGAAGLPVGFHEAGGEVYRRLAGWKDTPVPPSVADVAKALAR